MNPFEENIFSRNAEQKAEARQLILDIYDSFLISDKQYTTISQIFDNIEN